VRASARDIKPELAAAILDGLLPELEIEDDFMVEIAEVVQHEPNALRVMMGRRP